jgi:bacteriorhodopsin
VPTRDVLPPWTVPLTDAQYTLIEYGVAVAALCLIAMLTRVWAARREVSDRYRPMVHASVAVCTVAALSYVLLLLELHGGYRRHGGLWVAGPEAVGTWTARYLDWTVSVPLLVVEVVAVSAVTGRAAVRARLLGAGAAVLMVVLGFLGAVVIRGGSDFQALLLLGIASSVCFVVVYAVVITVVLRSLPVLPAAARGPMTGAMVLLLIVWFVYPAMYGLQGTVSGGQWTVTEHLAMSAADIATKVGFGLLLLRVARVRTGADVIAEDDVHPESIWIDQQRQSEGAQPGARRRSDP